MAKETSKYPIESFEQSWESNPKDKKPQSGKQVREFLFQQAGLKVGALRFDQKSQLLYGFATDEDAQEWEESGSMEKVLTKTLVSMTQKAIDITIPEFPSTNINLSTVTKSIPFSAFFTSKKKEYNEEEWTTVEEDIFLTVQVAHGDNGKWESVIDNVNVPYGSPYIGDLRQYLSTGINKVLFTAVGMNSGISNSVRYTFNMTTMYLDASAFSWHKAWMQGGLCTIDNLFYYAAASKQIFVKVDDLEPLIFERSVAQNAETAADTLDITEYVADLSTGVHNVKVWMEALEMKSTEYEYNVMYVREEDAATAKLLVINEVAKQAVNYDSSLLFKYASYGTKTATFGVVANDASKEYVVVIPQELEFEAENQNDYVIRVEVEQEEKIDLNLTASVTLNGHTQTVEMPVDNSRSFAATSGATFFLNPATRSNGEANRTTIINESKVAGAVPSYEGVFTNFAFKQKDGYVTDGNNRKCLVAQAGSTIAVPDFKPLSNSETQSMTIEMLVKAQTSADYSAPVLSLFSADTTDPNKSVGIIVFPTQIIVLSNNEQNQVAQSVNVTEDETNHLVVVLQRNYLNKGNLCHIYVNGVRNAVFSYGGTSNFGNGSLNIGQTSTDVYLYNMRVYPFVLEHQAIWSNFLNGADSAIRNELQSKAEIVDGGQISYDLCMQKGYNTILFEGDTIPDFDHTATYNMTWKIRYGEHPEWDVDIEGLPTDGQGTTSMKYAKWNLRGKGASDTKWHYPNNPDLPDATGKKGYLFGSGSPSTDKITAKKNVASSCQGHKMGGCGFYDALYSRLGLKAKNCPNTSVRVAVEQYPFLGFQKYSNGEIVFVGLYTMGADKGNKATFGYSDKFPVCLSLEGPNHNPLGTRFLHPWIDAVYDATKKEETLKFGGEEGWDGDYVGSHFDEATGKYVENSSDNAADQPYIQALYESEWKPAYEFIYETSLYIRTLEQVGMTISQINADVSAFRSGVTDGLLNECLQLLDMSDYKLYYYRNSTGKYEALEGFDILANLYEYLPEGKKTNPRIDDILDARARKFKDGLGNFFDVDSVVFHDCWQELTGTSDNDAKNFYPFKFKPLSEGGRWSFRQDDVDTSLATDNNGNSTKSYSIEKGDKSSGNVSIYQGDTSALFYMVRTVLVDERRSMMSRIIDQMQGIANDLGIQADTLHQTVYNVFNYYYWEHSAKYFPAIAYNKDSDWAYVDVWVKDPNKTYNGVAPLTQALGDQLKAEQEWVKRRIAYIFSRFNLGGFGGSSADGYGTMEFTPAQNFTFNVKPAIDLYPCGNKGGGTNISGGRTRAGDVAQIEASSDGSTTFYVKGMDWLTDIGDLSGLRLTSRGAGETNISFSVSSKRLRNLKVGDKQMVDVSLHGFNASSLLVSGESLETIDASNVTSISNQVSLLNCPRLRKAEFAGTNITALLLPVSAKITEVKYPRTLTTLFLHSLPLLHEEGIEMPENVKMQLTGLYLNSCDGVDGFAMLQEITSAEGHNLRYIYLVWDDVKECTEEQFNHLVEIAEGGYKRLIFDGSSLSNSEQSAFIQGTIHIDFWIYDDEVERVTANLPNIEVVNDKEILHEVPYTDDEVESILTSVSDARVSGRYSVQEAALVESLDVL